MQHHNLPHKAWVVTVDMGYGHQRPAHALRAIAQGHIITANNYPGIPASDRRLWIGSRRFYEFISRFKKVPLIGEPAFDLFDRFQSIPSFYPRRDLSHPSLQVQQTYGLFRRQQWGKHLIDKLAQKPLPLVTTFFVTAFMADYFDYPGDIYCITTDTDISRAWVPLNPNQSRIIYLASNRRVAERLKLYGVRPSNIFLTGFPLPMENVGDNLATIKHDLGHRLAQLDPGRVYMNQYRQTVVKHLGRANIRKQATRPVTITFAVGGAGAQRELGGVIARSLRRELQAGTMALNLIAGVNPEVNHYFQSMVRSLRLTGRLGDTIHVLYEPTKDKYFRSFNRLLRNTDILWTKPSELSFYCALGIPIIMAPPIGSQELYNRKWLEALGAGIDQDDPRYANEWLRDWLESGWLAEAAMQGYLEAPRYGTFNIDKVVFHHVKEAKQIKTVLQY